MKNKTLKSLVTLLSVCVLVISLSLVGMAADASVAFKTDDGSTDIVVFNPGSVFTETDLFDNFKCVMPGDERVENITVKNEVKDCDYLKIWLKAVPHTDNNGENPISPSVLARLTADERRGETPELDYMLDFLSQFSLEVYNGEESIYNASPDETAGLTEPVLLGMIKNGETLSLKAVLKASKELGNEYALRIGEVDWVFTAECFKLPPPPPEDTGTLTVRKIWKDDGVDRPAQIRVELLRDGEHFAETVLNEENQWIYTWDKLSRKNEWTAREVEVPEGYEMTSVVEGDIVTITNTKQFVPVPVEPVDITVVKKWDDKEAKNRPEKVSVTLYNGETAVETVVLGEWNNWTYTWSKLDGTGSWQAVETDIPKGYTPSYSEKDGVVTITNTGTLIPTGQNIIPIFILGGAGLLLVAFGVVFAVRRKDETHG